MIKKKLEKEGDNGELSPAFPHLLTHAIDHNIYNKYKLPVLDFSFLDRELNLYPLLQTLKKDLLMGYYHLSLGHYGPGCSNKVAEDKTKMLFLENLLKPIILKYIFVSLLDIYRKNRENPTVNSLLKEKFDFLTKKFEKMFVKKDSPDYLEDLSFVLNKRGVLLCFNDISCFNNMSWSQTKEKEKTVKSVLNNAYTNLSPEAIDIYIDFLEKTDTSDISDISDISKATHFSEEEFFNLVKLFGKL